MPSPKYNPKRNKILEGTLNEILGAVAAVQVSLKSKGKGTPPSAFELMAFTNIGALVPEAQRKLADTTSTFY